MAAPTPLRSMTGFGDAERALESGRLRVEIRTVNHRFLNFQIRIPNGLERLQPTIEASLRERFARGHVTVHVSTEARSQEEPEQVPVDMERARAYRDALRHLQAELGLGGTIEVALIAGFRDVFQPAERLPAAPDVNVEVLRETLIEAADRVVAMREEEGRRLRRDLEGRLDMLEQTLAKIEERAPERLLAERDRLRMAVAELLDPGTSIDDDRIAREVAHLADRWDIHEELVRFGSHLQMFRDTLESGSPDGIGKRFGFISQEILREANTIGSKANDAGIAAHVVTLKEEIERLREQLENVE